MGEVRTNGVTLHFETLGEGEPLLYIPGTGQRIEAAMATVIPQLAQSGRQVFVIANRGIAPSECPPAPYTVAEMARDTAGLIEHLGVEAIDVVGYSLGGFIAEELCYQRPELVRRVVLMACAGRASSFLRLAVDGICATAANYNEIPMSFRISDSLLYLLPSATLQDNDLLIDAVVAMTEAAPEWTGPGRVGQWSADREWIYDTDRLARWPKLTQRCLALAFEHDVFWSPTRVREAAEAMANATFTMVSGAAHGGVLTHQDDVSSSIIRFLSSE